MHWCFYEILNVRCGEVRVHSLTKCQKLMVLEASVTPDAPSDDGLLHSLMTSERPMVLETALMMDVFSGDGRLHSLTPYECLMVLAAPLVVAIPLEGRLFQN